MKLFGKEYNYRHMQKCFGIVFFAFMGLSCRSQEISLELGTAHIYANGDRISVSTGVVQRTWQKTKQGLRTVSLRYLPSGKEWIEAKSASADWQYDVAGTGSAVAKLVSLTARQSNDSGFTSEHLKFTAEYYYPTVALYIKYEVRVYPGAAGLFTQLSFKRLAKKGIQNSDLKSSRVEFIPLNGYRVSRRYFGYYNDTQHRNNDSTPLLREEVFGANRYEQLIDWASGLCLEAGTEGLALIKESHKCVNQSGHDTGGFRVAQTGVSVTGAGVLPSEILPGSYRKAWANWVILYKGSDDERQLAIKSFERQRYPVNLQTDVYILANTWGSDRGRAAATEANVLKELASQKELGIDVQQIDDGYQKLAGEKGFDPSPRGWYPVRQKFPHGFTPVKTAAQLMGVKLGLWFASMKVSLEEMKNNFDTARFRYYKLDFANLKNADEIETMVQKIRSFELYTNHLARVNWDVTENTPRFGYFWAKEYGAVFLENRKSKLPENVVYIPHLVLRDLWHISRYCNLSKFQGTIQNIDKVDSASSDAYRYNHPYCVAIALMSTPLFFQETQFYSEEAKQQVKRVLDVYKKVRQELYQCIVYPIGGEPNNKNWCGFQAQDPVKHTGFILLFRELENHESSNVISLRFLKERNIVLTDLMLGEKVVEQTNTNGEIKFNISQPAGFRFYRYEYN